MYKLLFSRNTSERVVLETPTCFSTLVLSGTSTLPSLRAMPTAVLRACTFVLDRLMSAKAPQVCVFLALRALHLQPTSCYLIPIYYFIFYYSLHYSFTTLLHVPLYISTLFFFLYLLPSCKLSVSFAGNWKTGKGILKKILSNVESNMSNTYICIMRRTLENPK